MNRAGQHAVSMQRHARTSLMDPATLSSSYVEHVARLERRLDTDEALRRAVGGEFMAVGKLEYHLLRSRGLRDDHLVVDVGCGSGRLACQLAPFPAIRYVGCDVVPLRASMAASTASTPASTAASTVAAAAPDVSWVCR